jgi:hypothetical protein
VGVPLSRIFIINPKGEIKKASSQVQSSTWSSLRAINELVHQVFPPLRAGGSRGGSRGGSAGGSAAGALLRRWGVFVRCRAPPCGALLPREQAAVQAGL